MSAGGCITDWLSFFPTVISSSGSRKIGCNKMGLKRRFCKCWLSCGSGSETTHRQLLKKVAFCRHVSLEVLLCWIVSEFLVGVFFLFLGNLPEFCHNCCCLNFCLNFVSEVLSEFLIWFLSEFDWKPYFCTLFLSFFDPWAESPKGPAVLKTLQIANHYRDSNSLHRDSSSLPR